MIFILKYFFFFNFILQALFQSAQHIYEKREGSGRPKNMRILLIRIRIPNTGHGAFILTSMTRLIKKWPMRHWTEGRGPRALGVGMITNYFLYIEIHVCRANLLTYLSTTLIGTVSMVHFLTDYRLTDFVRAHSDKVQFVPLTCLYMY